MTHPTDLWLVDAFTDQPFKGNPAGVCWLDRDVPDAWMQSLAMELNQAETAFVRREGDGFRLRWFTPAFEVDLCGHATLGSAHFLWASGRLAPDAAARFETRSGTLTADRTPDGGIRLDFPATPPSAVEVPPTLLPGLGLNAGTVLSNHLPQPDLMVVIDDATLLRKLEPDMAVMGRLPARGIIVTAPGDEPGLDFVSRFFGPAAGIPEDPVTGSAHCTLGPYWAQRLGRAELRAYQASSRGGSVGVRVKGNRVELTGRAVTVVRGSVDLPG
ncbi:MAG: PhzF family phenazine biosynthesis protein [Gemmatimonadales bacterium]